MNFQIPGNPQFHVPPGTVVDRRFTIIRELGRGGMGMVCLAQDYQTQQHVALKLLLSLKQSKTEHLLRMQREAQVLEQLQHENLVQVIAANFKTRVPYIALEFIPGTELKKTIVREGESGRDVTKRAQRLRWCYEIALAIEHCHSQGFIHRDIKPSNILIREEAQTAMLIDFGLVGQDPSLSSTETEKIGPTLTKSQHMLGTPHYMAPEQLDRGIGEIGAHSDVWALGATIFYVMTGHTPYTEEAQALFHAKRLTQGARSLSQLTGQFRRLEEIIDQCLLIDIDKRPPLRDLIEVLEIESKGQVLPALQQKRARSLRLTAAVVVAILVFLGLMAAFFLNSASQKEFTDLAAEVKAIQLGLESGQKVSADSITKLERKIKAFQPIVNFHGAVAKADRLLFVTKLHSLENRIRKQQLKKSDWTEIVDLDSQASKQAKRARNRYAMLKGIAGTVLQNLSAEKRLQLLQLSPKKYKDWVLLRVSRAKCYLELSQAQDALAQLHYCPATPEIIKLKIRASILVGESATVAELIKGHFEVAKEVDELRNFAWTQFQKEYSSVSSPLLLIWARLLHVRGEYGIRTRARKLIEAQIVKLQDSKNYDQFVRYFDLYCHYMKTLRILNDGLSENVTHRIFSFSLVFSEPSLDALGRAEQVLELYRDFVRIKPSDYRHLLAASRTALLMKGRVKGDTLPKFCEFVFRHSKSVKKRQQRYEIYFDLVNILEVFGAVGRYMDWHIEPTKQELLQNKFAQLNTTFSAAWCLEHWRTARQPGAKPDWFGNTEAERERTMLRILEQCVRYCPSDAHRCLGVRGRIFNFSVMLKSPSLQAQLRPLTVKNLRYAALPSSQFAHMFVCFTNLARPEQFVQLYETFDSLRTPNISKLERFRLQSCLNLIKLLEFMVSNDRKKCLAQLALIERHFMAADKRLKKLSKRALNHLRTAFRFKQNGTLADIGNLSEMINFKRMAGLIDNTETFVD